MLSLKFGNIVKVKEKKSLDLDEIYPDDVHHYRLNDKFTGHNGNVYQYNEDKDIYELAGEAPNYV